MSELQVNGFWDDRFDVVIDTFRKNFAVSDDVGASFAAVLDGEFVIDVWAGHLDRERSAPWTEHTIVNVFSTTKTMAALTTLVAADRGLVDLDAPVANYWPEFAQNGKEAVKVSHILSHSAGLSGLDVKVSGSELWDHDRIAGLLAAQAPWWEPGSASGYHAITQGYLLGELIKRVTGQSLGTWFRSEIAEPLDADFHIGLAPEHDPRVGRLIPTKQLVFAEDSESISSPRTGASPAVKAEDSWEEGWRRAELPAAGGHGNARSVAKIQSVLANGGEAFGVKLLSEEMCRRAFEEQTYGKDVVLGETIRFGMGYGLSNPKAPVSPNEHAGFWGGWGGSTVIADQDANLCFSYVMNRMEPGALGDKHGARLNRSLYGALEATA